MERKYKSQNEGVLFHLRWRYDILRRRKWYHDGISLYMYSNTVNKILRLYIKVIYTSWLLYYILGHVFILIISIISYICLLYAIAKTYVLHVDMFLHVFVLLRPIPELKRKVTILPRYSNDFQGFFGMFSFPLTYSDKITSNSPLNFSNSF